MRNSHPNITYAYHFLSEAIILFLIALPIVYHRHQWVPYWSYLAIIVGICIVYSIITRMTVSYFWYFLIAPILFFVLFFLDYPLAFAVIFPVLFTWRYINIRKEEIISRENIYIPITLILSVICLLIVKDSRIMIFPFLQFIILIIGYIISHLAVVQKKARSQFNIKLIYYFVGFLALCGGLLYLIFDPARGFFMYIWSGLLELFIGGLRIASKLLSFIDIKTIGWPEQDNESSEENGIWETPEYNVVDGMSTYFIVAVSLLLLGIVVFFIITFWKKRFQKTESISDKEDVYFRDQGRLSKEQSSSSLVNKLKGLFKKPSHPVRKMVYQFERYAAKNKKGRKPFETIEDWLKRIGFQSDFTVYQNVRYGNADVSDGEMEQLKTRIKELESRFESNGRG